MSCTKNDELIELTLKETPRLYWNFEAFMGASEEIIQSHIKDESDRETLRKALTKAIAEKIRETFVLKIPEDKKEE